MESIKRILLSMSLIFMVLLLPFSNVYAQDTKVGLDSVVVQRGDIRIKVSLGEYAIALMLENETYEYLKGDKAEPEPIYVSSTDKYINLGEYAITYMLHGNDEEEAINNSEAIQKEIVNEIKELKGFDDDGEAILEPALIDNVLLKDLQGDVRLIIPGKYGVKIKFDKVKEIYPSITRDSIVVLKVSGKANIELHYTNQDTEWGEIFLNPLISGYEKGELENAEVTIKAESDEEEVEFRVIDIY